MSRAAYLPKFHLLSGIQTLIDATRMRTGVVNLSGDVSSDGTVNSVISILPGLIGRTFSDRNIAGNSTSTVHKIKLVPVNGYNVLDLSGNSWLRSDQASSVWDFFSHNATFANLKWTVTILMRLGYGIKPGNFSSILGTNGGSAGAKGFSIFSDDRDASGNNNIGHQISKGTAGLISTSSDASQITPNSFDIYRFTFDGSQSAANRFKAYKNKVQLTTTVTSSSTATVTTPTNTLEIGNIGPGSVTGGFIGMMSHVILQNVVESTVTADAFEDSLEPIRSALNNFQTPRLHPYNFLTGDGTRYYSGGILAQDPTSPNIISRTYKEGSNHILDATSEVKNQISTDYGATWGTPSVVFTTGGANGPNFAGFVGKYDASGRLWMVGDQRTVGAVNQLPFTAWVFYSDDNGATWTFVDISANIPADGLDLFAFYGTMVETLSGRMMAPFYKVNAAVTSSAIYIMYSDDGGATWGTKVVKGINATYQNETALAVCGSRIIAYSRDENTKEYQVFYSDDDGDTWTDDGAETLGFTWTLEASPLTFSQFDLYGVNITVAWTCDRAALLFYGIFGSTLALEADAHAFDLGTKTMFRGRLMHYGSVVHPFNDINGIGSFIEEPFPATLTENRLISFYIGDESKRLIVKELGITPS